MKMGKAFNRINNCLIINLPADLDTGDFDVMQPLVLEEIAAHNLSGVMIDFKSISVIDKYDFIKVLNMYKHIELLGPPCVLINIAPEIAALLVDMSIPLNGVECALNQDDGLENLLGRTV